MQFTNEQMDAAIDRWRKMPSAEQLYADLAQDADFKAALEAAAERAMKSNDPNARFWEVDRDGWRPNQFNVDIPPARPNESDPFGPGASAAKIRKYQRHPGDPYPTY